jgi:arginase
VLSALGGAPLVRPEDVALVGPRDDPAWYVGDDVVRARGAMGLLLLDGLRRMGAAAAGAAIARRIAQPGLSGAWIHLDVDVLDDAVMPAVDSRQPGGISCDELLALLRPSLATGRVAGMQVTIYDPELDPDGTAGRALVDLLARLLGTSGSESS